MDVMSCLKGNEDFDAVCHAVLCSWDYDKIDAAHEGKVALFLLAEKGYSITNPVGLVRVALVNTQRDKYKSVHARTKRNSQDINELITGQGFCDNRRQINNDTFFDLIKSLSAEHKEMLIMKYIVGFEEPELADYFNIARGTVKSRASRAIKMLREKHDVSGSLSIDNFEFV